MFYLFLRVFILDHVDDLSHLELQLVHVLSLVLVGGLHLSNQQSRVGSK